MTCGRTSEQDGYAETWECASDDPYRGRAGIDLVEIDDGYAETTLTVTEDHLNFYGTPHRDVVYSLADATFAVASNSHDDAAFVLETNISYLTAAEVGETFRAVAWETHLGRRTTEHEVIVSNGDGERIATFRGHIRKPGGR